MPCRSLLPKTFNNAWPPGKSWQCVDGNPSPATSVRPLSADPATAFDNCLRGADFIHVTHRSLGVVVKNYAKRATKRFCQGVSTACRA